MNSNLRPRRKEICNRNIDKASYAAETKYIITYSPTSYKPAAIYSFLFSIFRLKGIILILGVLKFQVNNILDTDAAAK